jgi:hypothetical protein
LLPWNHCTFSAKYQQFQPHSIKFQQSQSLESSWKKTLARNQFESQKQEDNWGYYSSFDLEYIFFYRTSNQSNNPTGTNW